MSKKLIAICFAIALIMQSCSTEKMFSHKRYGHLNWIDHNTKVETKGKGMEPVSENKETKKENALIPLDSKTEISKTEEINSVQKTLPITSVIETETKTSTQQKTPTKTEDVVQEGLVNDIDNIIEPASSPKETLSQPASPKVDSDVLLILCIVLCFFIPPLAMYLWDKNTDSWFVIDLVLYLCLFLLIFGFYGLVGLLSVVIALLRVLEVI